MNPTAPPIRPAQAAPWLLTPPVLTLTLLLSLNFTTPLTQAQPKPPILQILTPTSPEPSIHLQTQTQNNTVLTLESSASLETWTPFATLHDAALNFPLPHLPNPLLPCLHPHPNPRR